MSMNHEQITHSVTRPHSVKTKNPHVGIMFGLLGFETSPTVVYTEEARYFTDVFSLPKSVKRIAGPCYFSFVV